MYWKKAENLASTKQQQKKVFNRFADLIQPNLKGFDQEPKKQAPSKNPARMKKDQSVDTKPQITSYFSKVKNFSYISKRDQVPILHPQHSRFQQQKFIYQKNKTIETLKLEDEASSSNQYPTFGRILTQENDDQILEIQSKFSDKQDILNTQPCSVVSESSISLSKGRISINKFFGDEQSPKTYLSLASSPIQLSKNNSKQRFRTQVSQRKSVGLVVTNKYFQERQKTFLQQTKPSLFKLKSSKQNENNDQKVNCGQRKKISPIKLTLNRNRSSKSIIKIGKNESGMSPSKKKQNIPGNYWILGCRSQQIDANSKIPKPLR